MKNKKILAAAMAAAVAFSVLLVPQFGSVKAANTNLIKNGDFSTDNLDDYIYSYGKKDPAPADRIQIKDEKAYIPARTNTAEGRFLNQKISLEPGTYRFKFDADITFTSNSDSQPFIFTVATADAFDEQVKDYNLERALTSIDGAAASVISTASGLKTPEIKNYGDKTGNAFAVKPTGENDHVGGKLAIDFNITTEQTVCVSIGINATTASAYIDNLELVKVNVQDTGLVNGDFESGDLTGYLPAIGTHNVSVVDTPKDGHSVTLNGSAAYLSGRGNGGTDSGFLTTEKITLPAGSYVWTFDVDLVSGDTVNEFIYGVYTGLLYGNRGYGSGLSIGCSANTVKTDDRFTVVGTANSTVHKKLSVTFNLTKETGVYLSFGFNDTSVGTVAYVDNLKLSKASVDGGNTTVDGSSFTPEEKDGYFVPYGSVVDSNNNKLVKNADGSFSVSDDKNISFTYFKTSVAGGITTFGVSKKEKTGEGNTPEEKAGIQFGSYTENAKDKKFYTLIIRGADESKVNKLTYGQKNDMVNTYLSWIADKENKDLWGKYTKISGETYVIKVVEQQKYMWKNSDGSKLQYAVRLYGDYSDSNADVNFSAIGFSMSGNTVGFADSFKTASYSNFN